MPRRRLSIRRLIAHARDWLGVVEGAVERNLNGDELKRCMLEASAGGLSVGVVLDTLIAHADTVFRPPTGTLATFVLVLLRALYRRYHQGTTATPSPEPRP